jgi:hypothetical protein
VLHKVHPSLADACQRASSRVVGQAFEADWALVQRDLVILVKELQEQVQQHVEQAGSSGSQKVLQDPRYLHSLLHQATCAAFSMAGINQQLHLSAVCRVWRRTS